MSSARPYARKQFAGDREKATTSEMRYDWLADRWVIIAPQRTQRPDDFSSEPPRVQSAEACPFCYGREAETPDAVATYPENADAQRWLVRVVPNKFPAVSELGCGLVVEGWDDDDASDSSNAPEGIDLFRRRQLFGAHEVIIESPHHLQSFTSLKPVAANLVFRAYRDRLRFWLEERKCAYGVLFKNVGQDAGASLVHTHSQLIATDLVPTHIDHIVERMRLFEQKEKACLHCKMIEDELAQESRIVDRTHDFVALCPFASRTPSLVMILPTHHCAHFERINDDHVEQVSWLTHRVLRRLEKCYPESAYNFVVHTSPTSLNDASYFHWRMELFPRLTKVAGFEWGSDCYINPLPPEVAARNLRLAGV